MPRTRFADAFLHPPPERGGGERLVLAARSAPEVCPVIARSPTGPARSGRPDDKLRDEAIQSGNVRT